MTGTIACQSLGIVGYRPGQLSEREIWACAQKVIDMHGSDAELHAALRADELLDDGDIEGQRVWKAILARIEEWRASEVPTMLQ